MKNKRNQGNRLLTICMVLLLAFSMLFTAVGTTENVQAASNGLSAYKKITFYKSGKVNGTIYSMKYNDRTNRYIVYASKNGKKKALLNSCSSGSIVTNGKYLYYESAAFLRSGSFGGTYKNRKLVQYNLKTRKNKVLISFRGEGPADSIIGCDGTYLYMGYQTLVILPRDQAVIRASRAYTVQNYVECIDELQNMQTDQMDTYTKYILASSYARCEALEKTNYGGITGQFEYDEQHNPTKDLVIKTIKDGAYTYLD